MDINKILENLLFYRKSNGKSPIFDYYKNLDKKIKIKIALYISLLIENNGKLGMPYSKHILDKIWELRVDFDKNYYRIFYFIFTGKQIVFLHGFNKKTNKTPSKEIEKAKNNHDDFIDNLNFIKL
ncbi:type II toxin-antitoxin system RelE/ParE family toxin [Patescibacteria group bacterium]|nr:type II toxin-antitoxin system RelE/ParE family toxin [Patescibacteria group bacterium]MBU4600609.1 type II toxin-antitoxin system RelE/ParE family toxin [Patescibacteria group bacterium]MCG2698357.1 type II toxin-antitoxin system RelE/ParE family toxin [Candidatus Parcubacteria bacterium]